MTEPFDPNKKPKLELPALNKPMGGNPAPQMPRLPGLPTPNATPAAPTPPQIPQLPVQAPQVPTPPSVPVAPVVPQPVAPPLVRPQQPVTPPPVRQEPQYVPEPQQAPEPAYREEYRQPQPRQDDYGKNEPRYDEREYDRYDNSRRDDRDDNRYDDREDSRYSNRNTRDEGRQDSRSRDRYEDEEPDESLAEKAKGRRGAPASKKKGFAQSSKGIKAQNKKAKKAEAANKPDHYAGSRKKVLYSRIAVFGIIGVLAVSGIMSYLPKASNLTQQDNATIISNVRADLGMTYFPRDAGEGWARGFATAYLNYDPANAEYRTEVLKTYAAEDFIEDISINSLTEDDLAALTGIEEPALAEVKKVAGIDVTNKQTVTQGPFLMRVEMLPGDTTAVYSYRAQLNGKNWIYLEVPVFYDATNLAMSIASPPTFRNSIPVGYTPTSEYLPIYEPDDEIAPKIESDINQYFKAWTASDKKTIDRYLMKEKGVNIASVQATRGLDGSAKFLKTDEIIVEAKMLPENTEITPEIQAELNVRNVTVKVRLVEPTSGFVYSQTYRMIIEFANENWFIKDIRNASSLADRAAVAEEIKSVKEAAEG